MIPQVDDEESDSRMSVDNTASAVVDRSDAATVADACPDVGGAAHVGMRVAVPFSSLESAEDGYDYVRLATVTEHRPGNLMYQEDWKVQFDFEEVPDQFLLLNDLKLCLDRYRKYHSSDNSPAVPTNEWVCRACSFSNDIDALICDRCSKRKKRVASLRVSPEIISTFLLALTTDNVSPSVTSESFQVKYEGNRVVLDLIGDSNVEVTTIGADLPLVLSTSSLRRAFDEGLLELSSPYHLFGDGWEYDGTDVYMSHPDRMHPTDQAFNKRDEWRSLRRMASAGHSSGGNNRKNRLKAVSKNTLADISNKDYIESIQNRFPIDSSSIDSYTEDAHLLVEMPNISIVDGKASSKVEVPAYADKKNFKKSVRSCVVDFCPLPSSFPPNSDLVPFPLSSFPSS